MVRKLQLEYNVLFIDYVSDLEKTVFTNNCLFFLSLSFYEGFGLGPIEALKHNKATIFTRVGIWKSYDRENAFIVENPLSTLEILDKIQQLLRTNLKESRDFENLLQFIKQFSWKSMANEYFDLYRSQQE
jgi:glycosyltransferase involved in cell wall biosynthesis